MNKNQIGTNAGIVWNVLKDNNHWEYNDLKVATGLSDRDLNAAIGWLAREDKIDFDFTSNSDKLFLSVNVYI
ncbi:winged helix-turn-helix domain-containing protein [Bacteroides ilei]|uniref:winged helix-turn-helix domain-containing protein n=1 Tax=Bacteroides ilei TaxID=1907658 RepID=UPI003AB6E580